MRAALLLAGSLAALPAALARAAPPDEPRFQTDLELQVGETRIVAAGPVQHVVCDRGDVAERVVTGEGNGFRGLAVGETTCSLRTADGVRRTFHVKVVARKRDEPGAGQE